MLTLASYSFGDGLLNVLEFALLLAWLFLLFYILGDLFRSHDLSGVAKASWAIVLIIPWVGTLAYLLVRGDSMHERRAIEGGQNENAIRGYGRETSTAQGTLPDDLERLSALYDQGSLSEQEFSKAKAQLLDPAAARPDADA